LITPIGQRQILQTAAAEAVRAAHEGSENVQREIARRQFLDQRLAEDQGAVHQVTSSENLRLEADKKEQKPGNRGALKGEPGELADGDDPGQAGPADSLLDFLA
jgi:hypothetical protein